MQEEQQKELFKDFLSDRPRKDQASGRSRWEITITLTWERAAVALIGLVVACALLFSFGVERGRKIGIAERFLIHSQQNDRYYIGPFETKSEAHKAMKEIMRR